MARGVILLLGALAVLGSAWINVSVNVPHLHEDFLELQVRPGVIRAASLLMYFAVVSMVAFGGMVLRESVAAFRGTPVHVAGLWAVAGAYVLFSAVAWTLLNRSPHILGYGLIGLVIAAGALMRSPRRDGS